MRRLARAALGVAMLAVLALAALVVLVPPWLASDAVRARIAAAGESALGREIRYERLEIQLSPLAFVMVGPVIAGATPGAHPLAQAPRATWRVSRQSLLTHSPWIDQVRFEGATLRFEDDQVEPAIVWELRSFVATVRSDSREAPTHVEASFAFAGGGHAVVRGSATKDGDVDLVFTLKSVELASLSPHLVFGARLAGAASGMLRLEGPVRNPSRVTARLALSGGDVQLEDFTLRGPLDVQLELRGPRGVRNGSFAVDATQAELAVGSGYRKAPGTPATIDGRVVRGKRGALGVDEVKLRVGDGSRSRRG